MRDIDGLADYAVSQSKNGKSISFEGVSQLNNDYIAKQAHGFAGVNTAIKEYNKLKGESTEKANKFAETIGKSNANLGKYLTGLKNTTGGMGGYALSLVGATAKTVALEVATMALNTAISFGVSFAISGLISLITSASRAREEEIAKAKEAASEANTLGDEIATLANKYITLSEAVKTDAGAKEDLISTQAELLEKLGLEGESIDDLITKYGSLSNAIKQASIDSLKKSQLDLIAGVNATKEELLDIGADGFFGGNNIINATGDDAVKAFKELEKAGVVSSGSYGSGGGSLVLIGDDTTTEGILENYQKLEDALNALRDSNAFVGGELTDNSLYQAIYARYDEMKEKVDAYKTSIGDLNENLAQQTMLTALQGSELPKSEQEFETFKQQLIDTAVASKQFIGNEKEIADSINSYLSKVPEFAEYFSLPLEDGAKNLDKMTASLENLNKEIDAIQSAYQAVESAIEEFNTTGSLSVDTYQTLTGLEAKYIPYLIDEQGNLTLTKDALNELTAARIREAAVRQAEDYIDYIAGLGSEKAQIDAITSSVNDETDAINARIAAKLREKINDGIISEEVAKKMVGHLNGIIGMAESAINGLNTGGLSKNAADNAKKATEAKEDYAKKVADINEDLAEKEKKFAEDMAEAWKEEHLAQLKDGLEKQKDIIDRYKKNLEITDFGLDNADENNFGLRSDLLSTKLEQLTAYGQEMRKEFERVASIIPQTGEEAQELASRIEELGSEMRDNISTIRETQIEIQRLRIDALASIGSEKADALQAELDNIDKRIELLTSENSDDFKYTKQILMTDLLLPVKDFSKQRKAKEDHDRKLIKEEQTTQDKINEIVSKALDQQSKDNAVAREKERQRLIADMEKARKDAEEKLADAKKDYDEHMDSLAEKTASTMATIQTAINEADFKLPKIDTTEFDNSAGHVKKTMEELVSGVNGWFEKSGTFASSGSFGDFVSQWGISSGFGKRIHPIYGTEKQHNGIDIPALANTPVPALNGGTVTQAGDANDNYGITVRIDHGGGIVSRYSHLSSTWLKVGQKVKEGDIIGTVGSTGLSTGAHLDFGVLKDGVHVDPTAYYANGTDSHPGGLAIVGDEYPGAYEAVILPNGAVKIFGKNGAEIVDLPRGTEVIPHDETKSLLSGKNIPRYAEGTFAPKPLLTGGLAKNSPYEVIPETLENAGETLAEGAEAQVEVAGSLVESVEEISVDLEGKLKEVEADLESEYNGFNDEYLKIVANTHRDQEDILAEEGLSVIDRHKKLFKVYAKSADEAAAQQMSIRDKVLEKYNAYIDEFTADPTQYSSEIVKAYEETLNTIEDSIYDIESGLSNQRSALIQAFENQISEIDEYINERNVRGDWDEFGDSEIKAIGRQIDLIEELYKDEIISREQFVDYTEDYGLKLYEKSKEAIVNAIEKQVEDTNRGFDIKIDRLSSTASLLSKHYGIVNAIAEEQHNINKELKEAEILGATMSEQEKKTLFTKKEHTRLSQKLNSITEDINSLQSDYIRDLNNATSDTIQEVTNHYERQYELKMKEYEIVRAEINLAKAYQVLENTKNEQTVRKWDGSNWVYAANVQKVLEASENVENARYELEKSRVQQAQQDSLNSINANMDSLETARNKFTTEMNALTEQMNATGGDINDILYDIATTDLPTYEKIIQLSGDALKKAFDISDSDLESIHAEGSIESLIKSIPLESLMKKNSDEWHTADKDRRLYLEGQNARYAHILGYDFDINTGRWKKSDGTFAYSSGTKNAKPGTALFDEEGIGSELIFTKDGVLTQLGGGERIFSKEMTDRLWEYANSNALPFNTTFQLDYSKLTPIEDRLTNIMNNISNMSGDTNIIKDVHLTESEGGTLKGFIDFLKKKV